MRAKLQIKADSILIYNAHPPLIMHIDNTVAMIARIWHVIRETNVSFATLFTIPSEVSSLVPNNDAKPKRIVKMMEKTVVKILANSLVITHSRQKGKKIPIKIGNTIKHNISFKEVSFVSLSVNTLSCSFKRDDNFTLSFLNIMAYNNTEQITPNITLKTIAKPPRDQLSFHNTHQIIALIFQGKPVSSHLCLATDQ